MAGLLYIGKVWPEPASSAAGLRTTQLLSLFSKHYSKVYFASAAARGDDSSGLSDIPAEAVPLRLNDGSFNETIAELQPEAVIFDRFTTEEQFGWRVAESWPAAVRILDTQDLHGLREARRLALDGVPELQTLHNDTALRETAAIFRCDLSLIISDAEMQILRQQMQVPSGLLVYVPYLFPPISQPHIESWKKYDERNGFVFIGNFRHRPNADAVRFLKSVIWPIIRRKKPGARLNIFGAYAPDEITSMHDPASGFYVMGRANSAFAVLANARVSVAPLRFGAGLKGKIAESWREGTPCVTTGIGAEGLGGQPWGGSIVDDPQHFAERCVQLHDDNRQWNEAHAACANIHNHLFCRTDHGNALIQRIAEIKNALEKFRHDNFTGAILRHQQHHAARWLGKYIETKNRFHATNQEH